MIGDVGGNEEMAAFLAARYDEDEAMIRRNSGGRGLADGFPDYRTYVDGDTAAADAYIERFGPVRMLGEVTAKRARLERYRRALGGDLPEWKAGRNLIEAGGAVLWGVLRDDAAVYSSHPEYRQAWKP